VRFLSVEPLLGPLRLDLTGIEWVIACGESGHTARPMHPDWVSMVRDQCLDAGVAFFFKRWGRA
jgi:protein gp37